MKHSFAQARKKSTPLGEINITNLIDVTMVLLIIFILLAPVIEQGISVNLPKTQAKQKFDTVDPVKITVKKDALYFDDQEIPQKVLSTRLSILAASNPEQQFIIKADKDLPYEAVINVMDMIQKAGFSKLALATQK